LKDGFDLFLTMLQKGIFDNGFQNVIDIRETIQKTYAFFLI